MRSRVAILSAIVAVATGMALMVVLWFVRMGLDHRLLLALVADATFMVVFGILTMLDAPRGVDAPRLLNTSVILRRGLRSLITAVFTAAVIGLAFGLTSWRG
jgi:hypothetical protein